VNNTNLRKNKKMLKKLAIAALAVIGLASVAHASGPTAPDLTAITDYVDVLVPALIALGGLIVTGGLGWMGFKFAARQGIGFFKTIGSK
jgi:hypothetical protein